MSYPLLTYRPPQKFRDGFSWPGTDLRAMKFRIFHDQAGKQYQMHPDGYLMRGEVRDKLATAASQLHPKDKRTAKQRKRDKR